MDYVLKEISSQDNDKDTIENASSPHANVEKHVFLIGKLRIFPNSVELSIQQK